MTAERAKYERVWEFPQYRHQAPGEALVDDAIQALGMQPGDTVIDFGCGTGRPAQRLQERGLSVTGVDFAANCLDTAVSIPFVRADLTDLPSMAADWGYCTDVMEHLPPEQVAGVLANIRASVRRGVYFQIATRPDVMGKLIGETLHLTVQKPDWWQEVLEQHWSAVEITEGAGWIQAIAR